MTPTNSADYALGSSDTEHERLIKQATRLAPLTEGLFLDAGLGPGHRVLDLGSGVGDVAMLAARLVGPTGEVVGIERDSRTIARARARVAKAGLTNVMFTQCDVIDIPADKPFDAVVGRYILMYLSDPVAVVRTLIELLRPGGIVALLEPSWAPVTSLVTGLPLWSAAASLIVGLFRRSSVNPEMGPALARVFPEAGLPSPKMRMEVLFGNDMEFAQGLEDLVTSLRPKFVHYRFNLECLGELNTLAARLHAELAESQRVASWLAIVTAWARKSAS